MVSLCGCACVYMWATVLYIIMIYLCVFVGVSLSDHKKMGRKHLNEPEKSDFTKLCSKLFTELNLKKEKKSLILHLKWL